MDWRAGHTSTDRLEVLPIEAQQPEPSPKPFETPPPAWPDLSVRRLVPATLPRVRAAIEVEPNAWLPLRLAGARVIDGELHVCATLHLGRCRRGVPVELVVAPWADGVTEVRLQLRSRGRRVCVPRGYFDAAHEAADRLRNALATRAATPRAHLRLVI